MDETNSEPTFAFVSVGSGRDELAKICSADRALVMVSVPWSGPEQKVRLLFEDVATRLQRLQQSILYFRLEVDEDPRAQEWLHSLGYAEFAQAGSGSLLWIERGKIRSALFAPLSESLFSRLDDTVKRIVERTLFLWAKDQQS